jgi:hypothetical protein
MLGISGAWDGGYFVIGGRCADCRWIGVFYKYVAPNGAFDYGKNEARSLNQNLLN